MQNATLYPDVRLLPYKLNVGCGNNKIDTYLNLDVDPDVKPDLIFDIKFGLPFPDNSASEILFFHTIEHIEERFHEFILTHFHRVLNDEGVLLISYPEFYKCAENYINNKNGMREFWKHTIYGLQRTPSDFHVSLMDSESLAELLLSVGFTDVCYQPEKEEPYNTIMLAHKGAVPKSYEDILLDEVCGDRN